MTNKCNTCGDEIRVDCDYRQGRCPHSPPLVNLEKIKMNIQPKDTSRRHFWASMIKSITRLGACAALYTGDYATAAIMFFAAELLGIAEELV
jgi:hypothetical protein